MSDAFPLDQQPHSDKQVAPLNAATVASARALFELQVDFTFFTLALPYMCAGLDSNLYLDFCQDSQTEPGLIVLKSERELVAGLEFNEFACGLFGLPNEEWEQFKTWVGSIAISDTRQKAWLPGVGWSHQKPPVLSRVRWQKLQIYDPLVVARKQFLLGEAHPPLVPIWAAVLEQPRGSVYFRPGFPPKAIFDPQLKFLDTTDLGGIDFTSIRSE